MITLYTWRTPNGHKASIMLEETGLPYTVHPVDLSQREQFSPEFLAVNPNGKIPALVDEEGIDGRVALFESGAILLYLAEKAGVLLPHDRQRRAEATEWLFWSVTGLSPMLGQWNYFSRQEGQAAALERFTAEVVRLFEVMERRLAQETFLAGEYSVADVGAYSWTAAMLPVFRRHTGERLGDTPAIDRWLAEIGARPAVKRGMSVP